MNVLIIEDDPMVEFIHRNYLEKNGQFADIYSASTIQEAHELLLQKKVDLILLDIHLKDGNGLDFLSQLRKTQKSIEVILITAASEASSVQEGLHLGVLDYLVKPFTQQRFQESLALFFKRHQTFSHENLAQETIDTLLKTAVAEDRGSIVLDKGLSAETLDKIKQIIRHTKDDFTIQDVAKASQLSHVSVRKYILFLEEHAWLESQVIYRKVGRPYKVYRQVGE